MWLCFLVLVLVLVTLVIVLVLVLGLGFVVFLDFWVLDIRYQVSSQYQVLNIDIGYQIIISFISLNYLFYHFLFSVCDLILIQGLGV